MNIQDLPYLHYIYIYIYIYSVSQDFPGGPVVKNPSTNARDTGSIPGLGRSHMPESN